MKKKVILICLIILIFIVPILENHSYNKKKAQQLNQIEQEYIAEFYNSAKTFYPYFKKIIELKSIPKGDDFLMDTTGFKRSKCVTDIIDLKNTLTQSKPRSELDLLLEYENITSKAWGEYAKAYQDKTSIDFNKLQKYIDTVDKVIYKFQLDPL